MDLTTIEEESDDLPQPQTRTCEDNDETVPRIVDDLPYEPEIIQIPTIPTIPPTVGPTPDQQTRRSNRVTERAARGDQESSLERAVRESRESGERIREEKEGRQPTITQEGQQPNDALDPGSNLDQILATLNTIEDLPDLDHDVDHDTPRTWLDAKNSPDATHWERSYSDELQSLKDMG
ncbi:hypothetical protein C0991_008377, partial [Blastosporella zonata]